MKPNADAWPADGASLWEALRLTIGEQELDRLYLSVLPAITLGQANGWVELEGLTWVSNNLAWAAAVQRFREKLIGGNVKAKGYVEPVGVSDKPQEIPQDKWRLLDLDFARSAAKGSGMSIVGIKVRPADGAELGTTERPEFGDRGTSRYENWERQQNELCFPDGNNKPVMTYREAANEIADREGVNIATVEREARRVRREKAGKAGS